MQSAHTWWIDDIVPEKVAGATDRIYMSTVQQPDNYILAELKVEGSKVLINVLACVARIVQPK